MMEENKNILTTDDSRLWVNREVTIPHTKMHPVMSKSDEAVYFVSDDEATLRFDIGNVFSGYRFKLSKKPYYPDECIDMIYAYLEDNLSDFYDKVEHLILRMSRPVGNKTLILDFERLKKIFPNLSGIYHKNKIEIINSSNNLDILDPFELGELSFKLAREEKIEKANYLLKALWALDMLCAQFYRSIAMDYLCKNENHPNFYPEGSTVYAGMDNLFRIYLFGWYSSDCSFDDEHKIGMYKYKNFDKAIELLSVRFKNWNTDEICEKLYFDMQHIKHSENFDYEQFADVLSEVGRLYPEVLEKMQEKGWVIEEVGHFFPARVCNMCGNTFDFWDHQQNICFDRFIEYGSAHDCERIRLNLCCKCFDKTIDWLVSQCKFDPIS